MQFDSSTLRSLLRPRRRAFPFSLFTIVVALAAAFGCGGGGCSCMAPIPGGFPAEERTENAAQIRVSSTGLAAITDDPGALVSGLTGGPLTFDVPPSCGGTPSICCNGTTPVVPCGPLVIDLDEQPGDAPRMVITPVQGSSRLEVVIRARVHTETPLVVGIIGATCQLAIQTEPGAEPDLMIETTVNLVVDPPSNTTRVEVGAVRISQLVAGDDLALTGEGLGNGLACAAFGFVLPLAQDALVGTFQDAIKGAIEGQLCKACPGGDVAECGEFATACTDNVCMQSAESCLQELGVAGRLQGVFAGFSPGTTGTVDLYEVAGGYATTNNGGIALGLLGGMLPAGEVRDRCGPSATAPGEVTIPESAFFRGNVRPDTSAPFDVAIGVHEHQLDRFAYSAYQGGMLCLTIGTAQVDLLNSDTLGLFIPSLANLIEGPQSMALGLRPQSPPTIVLGRNTFVDDGSGGTELGEPLLDIDFTALELDFFVSIEDQYVRLFTLVADVHLPVGLEVGEGEIIPVLGDLDAAFSNLSVKNAEPLTETPEELAEVFPTLLDLALPQLAGALGGFALPEIGGLNIQVTEITAVDDVTFLAIFGELVPPTMAAPAPRVDTTAELVDLTIPGTEVFADTLRWDPARRPRVELALGGDVTGLEWSHRIDRGLWTPWSAQAHRSLSSNLFWLQGHHQVEVRARRAGRPETVDLTPVVLRTTIDTLPPTPAVELIPGGVHVNGADLVSRRALRMRWRIAGGAWTEAKVPSVIPLAEGMAPRDLEIEMFDEVGNRSPARGPADVARAPFHGQAQEAGCGCSSGQGSAGQGVLLLGLGALALLGRGRRRRVPRPLRKLARVALLLGAVLAAASLPACDCGGDPPCGPVECMEGEVAMGAIGRFNGVASSADRTVVSTYDETLGDLVLVEVAAGSEYAYTAVDGIPEQTPSYQPSTYRGGVPTPGPDVGAWSSVALDDGLARIAYQDRDLFDLKVAVEDDDHRFTSHVVDGDADEIVGAYASIAITAAGAPAIAYLATNIGDGAAGKTTELRLARASGPSPTATSDWTVTVIASAPTSCAGLCGDDRACLPATGAAPESCVATGAGCPAECADTEACIASVCTAIVDEPPTQRLPGGLGLFANLLVRPDGRLTVVHYDMNRTALIAHVETAASSGSFTEVILDGEDGSDRGMWATAVVSADGTVHIAYQESLGDQVFYTTLASAPGPIERVDDGVRDGDRPHIVGAGAVIFLDGTAPQIVYQDGIAADLVQATRAGNAWTHAPIASGALIDGFHLAATPDGAWLVWDSLDKLRTPATGLEIRELN